MQQEQGCENGENRNQTDDEQTKGKPIWSVTGTAIAIQVYIIALFLLWVFIPVYVQDYTQAVKVCIESMFSLAIVDVIVVHAIMYYKQAKEVNKQTEVLSVALQPSLRITDVRIEDFEEGKEPVFIVSIKNDGRIDARNVSLGIRVSVGRPIEGALAKKLAKNIVTIPAGQEQHYFVPWEQEITQEHIKRFNNKKAPLKVSGTLKIGSAEEMSFCYRYYAWRGERPKGVPQFVPCDFDTRLTTVVTPGTAHLKAGSHIRTIEISDPRDERDENESG